MSEKPIKKDTYYLVPGYNGDVVVTCKYCYGRYTLPPKFIGEYACGSCGRYITISDGSPPGEDLQGIEFL